MLYVDIVKKLDNFTLKVSFKVDGEVTALFGPSGAGKSMTLKCIAGIEKPDSGVIQLNRRTLFDSSKHINLSPQKRKVGYLFQEYALFPNFTVKGNIEAGMHSLNKADRLAKSVELIDRFRLNGLENQMPSTLSGGEQQRVALARMFASQPEVILLDEPFASLDILLKAELIPYIKDIINSFGGETILVSHDVDEVLSMCEKVTEISAGVTDKTETIEEFKSKMKEIYKKAGLDIGRFNDHER